jgi:hypothetical protein
MAKHFGLAITDDSLTATRRQAQIDAEAALDGLYVIRAPLTAGELDGPGVVAAYLTWHLRRAWAPLTFTDENPPVHPQPARPPGHPDPQPGPVRRHQRPWPRGTPADDENYRDLSRRSEHVWGE